MRWIEFERENKFEDLVLDLTNSSIAMIAVANIPDKCFSAFAFNCSSLYGDISLSFGVNPGYEDEKGKSRLYPPDWEYEVMQSIIKEVGELWEASYAPVQAKYEEIIESLDDCESFSNGFLHSLRRVMVRLERQGSLQALGNKPVWTLVTEIDADTRHEERLLEQERKRQV